MQAPHSPSSSDLRTCAQTTTAHTAAVTADLSVHSESLLRGQKSVTIVHNGTLYRLQATKLGKLILTK